MVDQGGYVDAAEHKHEEERQRAAATKISAIARGVAVRRVVMGKGFSGLLAMQREQEAQRYAGVLGCVRRLNDERRGHSLFLFVPSHPVRRLSRLIVELPIPGTPLTFTTVIIVRAARAPDLRISAPPAACPYPRPCPP